jgi:hypothetical protein
LRSPTFLPVSPNNPTDLTGVNKNAIKNDVENIPKVNANTRKINHGIAHENKINQRRYY